MKKTAFLFCAMIVGFSFIISSSALALDGAQPQKRGMMGRHCISRWEMFKFIKNFDITEEQKAALEALKDETDNKTKPVATQIVDLQNQMTDNFLAVEIDTASAETQIDAMLGLQTQLSDILLHAELQAVQILTADQRTLILEMVNKLRACADAQHGWMVMNKPAYFSLLMPAKAL